MTAIVAVIAHRPGKINGLLVDAWRDLGIDARLLAPAAAVDLVGPGDTALLRLDVTEALDGPEPGFGRVPELRSRGARILNAPWGLVGAHDKLETARRLREARLPHPPVVHVLRADDDIGLELPVVVKPRHGSWGRDVLSCRTEQELRDCLRTLESRDWFRRRGALVQELVEPVRRDLRVIVAGGAVVGAAQREARPGEWRTNVSLGGRIAAAEPDEQAARLALAAVEAVGCDLAGVDLLPLPGGGYTVLELNGAVDFDGRYSLASGPIFAAAAQALELPRRALRPAGVRTSRTSRTRRAASSRRAPRP